MVGNPDHNDKTFKEDDYEEFYEDHHFQPLRDADALNCHEVIPRFGWAFDKVQELKVSSLLDLGCLDGSFPLTVAKHLGMKVAGVDLTKDGIKIASHRARENGLDATFAQGTAENYLQYCIDNNITYDIITAFEIIEHVKDVPLLLGLIDKVLSPGGSVLLSTPSFESPIWGMDDEQNKCHVRLYTTKDEDYEAVNKYGNTRKATSMPKEVGPERIKEMGIYSELINVWYQ